MKNLTVIIGLLLLTFGANCKEIVLKKKEGRRVMTIYEGHRIGVQLKNEYYSFGGKWEYINDSTLKVGDKTVSVNDILFVKKGTNFGYFIGGIIFLPASITTIVGIALSTYDQEGGLIVTGIGLGALGIGIKFVLPHRFNIQETWDFEFKD